ncbi:hypothetical protein SDJN02_24661, partial [Cucurbita argyrosperma subsp. argyrosperma]
MADEIRKMRRVETVPEGMEVEHDQCCSAVNKLRVPPGFNLALVRVICGGSASKRALTVAVLVLNGLGMGTDPLLSPAIGPPIKRRAGLRIKQAGRGSYRGS